MKVALVSANLGAYDRPAPWLDIIVPPDVELSIHRLTDADLPPRPLAMTSRLMCGIPKMDGYRLCPGADVYVWMDASVSPTPHAVAWWLDKLAGADLAVFQHPERSSIREEFAFMRARMARPGERYLNARYRGEWFDALEQWIADESGATDGLKPQYRDDRLFASTAFAYRPAVNVKHMLAEWWWTKSRFMLHDQLAWPLLIWKHCLRVNVIPDNYLSCEALRFARTGIRRTA